METLYQLDKILGFIDIEKKSILLGDTNCHFLFNQDKTGNAL